MLAEERATWRGQANNDKGTVLFWFVPPNCFGLRLTGHIDARLAIDVCRLFEECLRQGKPTQKLHGICDYFEITGVDAATRNIIQEYVKRYAPRLAGLHYGVRSPFVVLGVQVAAIFHKVPSFTYSTLEKLDVAMRKLQAAG